MRAFTRIAALMAMMGLGAEDRRSKPVAKGRSKRISKYAGGFPVNPRKLIPKGCKEINHEGHRIVYLNKQNLERKIRNIQANG
jgi:hypothetical protein